LNHLLHPQFLPFLLFTFAFLHIFCFPCFVLGAREQCLLYLQPEWYCVNCCLPD
jgi:hypothetical protein